MDPMIDKTSPEFNRMTVSNFRFLDAATMSALAQDLRLSCTSPSLFFIQHHSHRINSCVLSFVHYVFLLTPYVNF